MTDRRILTSLFVAGAITIGGLSALSDQPTKAQRCAQSLHIAYSVETGATSHLDAFQGCMEGTK